MTFIRQCSRPGCTQPAHATLEFNYAKQVAIIGPLQPAGNPHRWDLCATHVQRTSVPQGWHLNVSEELTSPNPPTAAPSAGELGGIAGVVGTAPHVGVGPRPGTGATPHTGVTSGADGTVEEPTSEEEEEELLALAQIVARAYETEHTADTPPAPRVVRREEVPLPSGRHPARRNLPSTNPKPRRHLRVVDDPTQR